MFHVNLNGKEYGVWFQHQKSGTKCVVATGAPGAKFEDRVLVAEAASVLSEGDKFNRSIGREVALGRVLRKNLRADKNTRKLFWEAYWRKLGETKQRERTFKLTDSEALEVDKFIKYVLRKENIENTDGATQAS